MKKRKNYLFLHQLIISNLLLGMKNISTIYLSAIFFFGVFLFSQPIMIIWFNLTNYSTICTEKKSLPVEENTEIAEKEFATNQHGTLFAIARPVAIVNVKLFIQDEQYGHLFIPSILVPPPERIS